MGLNAGLKLKGAALVLGRHEAHGAVLLDELVTWGRRALPMFTSAASTGSASAKATPPCGSPPRRRVGLVGPTAPPRSRGSGRLSPPSSPGLGLLARSAEAARGVLPVARRRDPTAPASCRGPGEVEVEAKYAGYLAQADAALARGPKPPTAGRSEALR